MRANTKEEHERSFLKPWRAQEASGVSQPWQILAAGAVVPLGLAVAAAYTSRFSESEKVARTSWISLAIVGTAAVIAAAAATHRVHGNSGRHG